MKRYIRVLQETKKIVNGYTIRYNPMWKTFQVSYPEIGTTIAEFYSEKDAIEYAKRG